MNEQMAKDLVAVQNELHNPKNTATNPFLKNKYAPLDEILNVVRPALNRHGFFLSQNIATDHGSQVVTLQTALIHESGEAYLGSKMTTTVKGLDAQKVGSAITYFRRYQLSSLLGIASEDDDDANSVSTKKESNKPKTKKPAPPKPSNKPSPEAPKIVESKGSKPSNPPKKSKKASTISKKALIKIFKLSPELKEIFQPIVDAGEPVPVPNMLRKADELYADKNLDLFKQIKELVKGK